jgi:hypothetical protein
MHHGLGSTMQRTRMPQLIGLAFVAAGLYAGYRWLSKEFRRAAEAAEQAREALRQRTGDMTGLPKDLGPLEWDEKSGVYRPTGKG